MFQMSLCRWMSLSKVSAEDYLLGFSCGDVLRPVYARLIFHMTMNSTVTRPLQLLSTEKSKSIPGA
jgi:hypothetical protein